MADDAGLGPVDRDIERAAGAIGGGGVVAFPTETFYGLAVDPRNADALERLLRIKGREAAGKPVLLLIARLDDIAGWAAELPPSFDRLAAHFWPGPLTLVLPASPGVHPSLVGPGGGIALRLTAHPVAAAMVRRCGVALTGTSANRSGEPPCADAASVRAALGAELDAIVDGGPTTGGKPSTLVDLCAPAPAILRQGAVPRVDLERVIGLV